MCFGDRRALAVLTQLPWRESQMLNDGLPRLLCPQPSQCCLSLWLHRSGCQSFAQRQDRCRAPGYRDSCSGTTYWEPTLLPEVCPWSWWAGLPPALVTGTSFFIRACSWLQVWKESGAGQVHVASGPKSEVGSLWFEPSTPIPRVYPVSVSSFNEAFANSVSSLSPFLALL